MRVAILAQFPIHVLPPFAALGEPPHHYATWLPQLASSFAEAQGLEIHWVTLSTEVKSAIEIEYHGQRFHVLPTAASKRASTLFWSDRAAIKEALARIQPQVVHGWGNEDVYGLAAATSGCPSVVSVQGLLSYYALKNRLPARTYFQALIELFVINGADQLICESLWARDMTRRFLMRKQKPIHHIEYGVQNCFFDVQWRPDPKKPVVIFTGSADPRKGIQDLVRAFYDTRLAHAELWVLGNDTTGYAKRLKKQASPNVRWFGRRPIEESLSFLSQGWCFALPTRADTGPMAVKEARVVGLPVISSPKSGARDYIRDGKNGFLVDPGDVSALTEALVFLMSDLALCRRMGADGHEEAREQFHPQKTADQLVQLYQNSKVNAQQSAVRQATPFPLG